MNIRDRRSHTAHLVAVSVCSALLVTGVRDWRRVQAAEPPLTTRAAAIEIVLEDPPASTWKEVTFEPIDVERDPQAVRKYVAMVRRELSRYPPAFMERSELRSVVVVQNLCNQGQLVAVVPDHPKGILYADPAKGAHDFTYQRHALHHDFFHYLMGRWQDDTYFKDPEWIALNPPGTSYGRGGRFAQQGNQYEITHPAEGFINLYSQAGVEEDMAEVFAALQIPEERRLLLKWAKEDAVLKRKIEYMEAFVARHSIAGEEPTATNGPASRSARP